MELKNFNSARAIHRLPQDGFCPACGLPLVSVRGPGLLTNPVIVHDSTILHAVIAAIKHGVEVNHRIEARP